MGDEKLKLHLRRIVAELDKPEPDLFRLQEIADCIDLRSIRKGK